MVSILFLVCLLFLSSGTGSTTYEEDGDYIIGAILPITKHSGTGKCTRVNPKGVAFTEAIIQALNNIKSDSEFNSLLSTKKFGYVIRDSCSDPVIEREIAYEFNEVALNYAKNKSAKRPVNVVISSFDKDSIKAIHILNIENIPQISYSKNNIKLLQDSTINDASVKNLISSYPENTMKIMPMVDIVQKFKFQYVYGVFSADYQSNKAKLLFAEQLKKRGLCESSFTINDESDIPKVVSKLKQNKLVKVVVVHCNKDIELKLLQKLSDEKMSELTVLSTQDWSKNEGSVKRIGSLVNGMIYLQMQGQNVRNFEVRLKGILRPYQGRDWVKRLYEFYGGKESCLRTSVENAESKPCFEAEEQVKIELSSVASKAVYVYDAVYTIANALLRGTDIISEVKGLKFPVFMISSDEITYTDHLTTKADNFLIQNFWENKTQSTLVGFWSKNIKLRIYTEDNESNIKIRWKDGSTQPLESTCSSTCQLGFKRKFINVNSKCCWECDRCPNGTFSNVTNADRCLTCGIGCVAKPDQTGFVYYKLEQFNWFGPSGSFIIFLIVVGCALVLLALGIISQNSDHDLIQLSGYILLCFFLIGCLLLFIAPIPLLATPSGRSCTAYITIFNFGLTIIFSVLITRSSYINSFYEEDSGEVIKGGLGKSPRLTVIVALMLTQLIILCAGLAADRPKTLHNDTNQWDVKWWECSSWASIGFWVSFGYNLALSIVGNFLSCSSTKLDVLCSELKWILLTYLIFYLNGVIEIIIFYRIGDEQLAVGQALMCIVMGLCFYFLFIWPKMFYILFRAKRDPEGSLLHKHHEKLGSDDESCLTTALSSADGYKHGVVQMRVKQHDENNIA